MESLEVFKRRVGYRIQADQDSFTANELTPVFNLTHDNVSSVQIYLDGDLYPATNYTVDTETGTVTLSAPLDNDIAVLIKYEYAPFSDAEANALITAYGLDKAVIEALREILANQARLRNYKQADTEVDNSQVFKQVRELLKMYTDEYQTDQSSEASLIIGRRADPRGESYSREGDISRLYG